MCHPRQTRSAPNVRQFCVGQFPSEVEPSSPSIRCRAGGHAARPVLPPRRVGCQKSIVWVTSVFPVDIVTAPGRDWRLEISVAWPFVYFAFGRILELMLPLLPPARVEGDRDPGVAPRAGDSPSSASPAAAQGEGPSMVG